MPRKKITLSWIAHDATRRVTFKKRKQSLFKKTSELATLCGVDVCAVVYRPEEAEPEVWPSPAEAKRVLARLRAAPEPYQGRKKMDQADFLRLRVAKLQDQIHRQQQDNWELETNLLLHEVLSTGGQRMCNTRIEEAAELVRLVEFKLVLVSSRIEREKARTLVEPPWPLVEQVVGGAVAEFEPELLTEENLSALPWPELSEEDLAEAALPLPWPEPSEEPLEEGLAEAALPLPWPWPEPLEEDLAEAALPLPLPWPWPEPLEEDLAEAALPLPWPWPEPSEEDLAEAALPLLELSEEDLTEVEPELTKEDLAALPWPELTEEDSAAVPLSSIDPESAWLELDYHQWQDAFDLFNNFNY
ncbi:MADS-box protein defh21-like [Zingiber officinale]|uniref:MADS-box domain-containing protein n=1 Tax=Zingiber officinale TaxID=94328 RepID=A0A8J5LUH2_ZINOF|nr:MADS-box protein defh21-like [Zingiber officinale]KAG6530967.1 hypothetical protein ZIOFF_004737 [Zingiber officinale]